MFQRNPCSRETQRQLFAPPSQTPTWSQIPAKVQTRTIRLLAQILGAHRTIATSTKKEVSDER
jgi:hypothetical protein